jgi:RNA polymerase sigma-70 factor (ECF subfamily)
VASTAGQPPASGGDEDWGRVVELTVAGDRRAYGKLVRLVTGHLAHWRAYDFSADWEDIIQEVVLSVVQAHAAGKLAPLGALEAYARQATRFKFIDCIRMSKRQAPGTDAEAAGSRAEASWPPSSSIEDTSIEMQMTIWRAIEALPERERLAVVEVHARGRTYEEAAEATGIPLGSLKRALRVGLALLRESLEADASG